MDIWCYGPSLSKHVCLGVWAQALKVASRSLSALLNSFKPRLEAWYTLCSGVVWHRGGVYFCVWDSYSIMCLYQECLLFLLVSSLLFIHYSHYLTHICNYSMWVYMQPSLERGLLGLWNCLCESSGKQYNSLVQIYCICSLLNNQGWNGDGSFLMCTPGTQSETTSSFHMGATEYPWDVNFQSFLRRDGCEQVI